MEICKLAVAFGGDIYVTDIYVVQLYAVNLKVLTFASLFVACWLHS